MRIHKYIAGLAVAFAFLSACDEGIDPINAVAPGTDSKAPEVSVGYPSEGTLIRIKEDVATIKIETEVTDDIELKNVVYKIDGADIATFSGFKDYRRALSSFTYTNVTNGQHVLSVVATDLSGKSTTKTVNFTKDTPYKPVYSGEVAYLPFDGDFTELLSITNATKVGSPTFVNGKKGKAYAGAADSYLKFPTTGMLNTEFSAIFWYKVNTTPDRSGILVIGNSIAEDRTKGFRLFREGSTAEQTLKINVGTGSGENWIDICKLYPTDDWKQIAISISGTTTNIYVNGALAVTKAGSIGWDATCTVLSIASGAPTFSYWGHAADLSQYDELRVFNRALSDADVLAIYNAEKQ